MPHPKKYPVTEAEMEYTSASLKEIEETRYFGHHTICQTMRDIYQMAKDPDLIIEEKLEGIMLKSRLAMSMAKAMTDKLHEYKNKYEPDGSKHVITK
jgi:hypothetical protein